MMNNVIKNFVMGDVTGLVNQAEQARAAGYKAEGAITDTVSVISFTEEVKKFIAADASNDINTENNAPEQKEWTVKKYDVSEFQLRNRQGNEIIAQALTKVSELLNLPENVTFDTEEIMSFEAEDMVMFADVLWAIDTVTKLFEKAGNDPARLAEFVEKSMIGSHESGMISNMEEAGKIDEIVAELRSAKTHLDFGFYLLGMNDIIAEQIAQKHGVNTVTGIAQAANPEDLGMSTNDSARLFGSLIKEELTSAMERVRQITSGQAEMTELEKAAVRLGTVNSEILKAALYKTNTLDGTAFENVNLEAVKETIKEAGIEKLWSNADVNKLKANVEAIINTKAVDVDFELPISAKESINNKIRESVEAANRSALQSVEGMTAKFVTADNNIEIPISVLEAVNKKSLANNNTTHTSAESASVKITFADNSVDIPVSAIESINKKAEKPAENKPELTNHTAKAETVNNLSIENIIEDIDSQETEGVASVKSAEAKATETLDKAEKTFAPFTRFEQEAIMRQMTERMNHAIRSGAHELRMILRPESLGEVRMSLRVEGDVVMARMVVENRQIKAIVESNMQTLKDDLAKHNLSLGGFSVDVGSDNNRSMQEVWQEMAEKSGHRKFKADADGSGSENENENDSFAVAAGSDTGRRFGNNTFEYFI